MMKIFINKNDEIASVVEQMLGVEDTELMLVVPRFARISESAANFHILKREADAAGKSIQIESVDDQVISLARASRIDAGDPFFGESTHREVTDIVRRSREALKSPLPREAKEKMKQEGKMSGAGEAKKYETEEWAASEKAQKESRPQGSRLKKFIYAALVFAVLGTLGAVAWKVLQRADIKLVAQKAKWEYNDNIIVDKAGTQVVGQIFSKEQNQSFSAHASGKKTVEKKAQGTVTIYNAYSSSPQYLVATTRFVTPDGKVFRLDKGVNVPGAKVMNGAITPSFIEAQVSADKAGAEYNVGPVAKLAIPGFQGTPRYNGFYGELKNGATGGIVGEVAFPTADDITKAKRAAEESLKKGLETFLLAQVDSEFRVIQGASQFEMEKENVIEEVTPDGKFSVFVQGKMNVMAFRESDVVKFLEAKAQKELGAEFKVSTYDLKFQPGTADFVAQTLTVPVNFSGMFAYAIDISNFKSQAVGKAQADLKTLIFGMPGVQSATVNLWPFWVFRVPQDESKITVTIE